jgi:nucleotide-binding universal stress UspA family protein
MTDSEQGRPATLDDMVRYWPGKTREELAAAKAEAEAAGGVFTIHEHPALADCLDLVRPDGTHTDPDDVVARATAQMRAAGLHVVPPRPQAEVEAEVDAMMAVWREQAAVEEDAADLAAGIVNLRPDEWSER